MLRIRREQFQAFEDAALRSFENDMLRHLGEFASKRSQSVGESKMRQGIRLGVERAERYGFSNRGPLRFYLECMLLFGSDFDSDPLLPWARRILTDSEVRDQMARARQLFQATTDYLQNVFGPGDVYEIEALKRIHAARFEDYPVTAGDYESVALRALKDMYPEKCAVVGEPALRRLVQRGLALGQQHGTVTDLSVALLIALPFAVGHGFASDPFFPWIEETLSDPRIIDPGKRIERLYTRTKTYLAEALNYFEERASHVQG